MIKYIFIFIIFLFHNEIKSQDIEKKPDLQSKVSLNQITYSTLNFNKEQHSSFILNYDFNNNLKLEFENHYDTYTLDNRFRSSFRIKHYITNKLYVFGGAEIEFSLTPNTTSTLQDNRSRQSVNFGLGYDIKDNLSFEIKNNTSLHKKSIGAFGESLLPTSEMFITTIKLEF